MNNDRFDDALRRKLEEVNPPFQEKNWTQLRRFMAGRGFPPSIWHAPVHWLQPALTAAAAASLLVVSIWQYRTNQTLNDRIQTLTTTVSKLEQVQTSLQKTVTDIASQPRPDTVYVVQRVPVAMPSPLEPGGGSGTFAPESGARKQLGTSLSRSAVPQRVAPHSVPTPTVEPNAVDAPGTLPAERWSARTGQPQGAMPRATDERVVAAPTSPPEPDAAPTEANGNGMPMTSGRTEANANAGSTDRSVTNRVGSRQGNRQTLLSQRAALNPAAGDQPSGTVNSSVSTSPTRSSSPSLNETPVYTNANPIGRATNATGTQSSIAPPAQRAGESFLANVKSVDRITSLTQSDEWVDSWQRRLRRVRYRSPYAQAPTEVAAVPAKHTNPTNLRWRLGVGGDATTAMSTYGVYGELVVNNRLTISAGFGQATWSGDSYQTEIQFSERTKRDFRREYPNEAASGNMGPGNPFPVVRKFVDINRTASALLMPLQVGYRLDIGRKFFLTPSVGATIGLGPSETVSFAYERIPRDYEQRNLTYSRPVGLYSSWTLGVGLERQMGPFVAQLSPIASAPVMGQRSGLNATSVGLRARVYYQF